MRALAVALALLCACDQPRAYLMCHNANCTGSEPFLDATLPALRNSLALRWNGEPLIDGIELDLVWDVAGARCAFAHDATQARESVDGLDAAHEVAMHIRDNPVARRVFVKLDMKAPAIAHREALVDCALAMYETIAAAAVDVAQPLTLYFESEEVALVRGVVMHPHYPGKRRGERIQTGLIVPVYAEARGLEIDLVSVEAGRVKPEMQPRFRELRSRGIELMVWMFDADPTVLAAIEEADPLFINTNEAVLLREWLGERPDG